MNRNILNIIVFLFININQSWAQHDKLFDKEYREKTHQLFKENKIDEIEIKHYGERDLPYFNVWETLYFYLRKGEFNAFFLKIEEYSNKLNYGQRDLRLSYYDPHSPDDREYLFEYQTSDDLWEEVKSVISKHPSEMLVELSIYSLDSEQQDFIELFLYYMVWYFYRAEDKIDNTLTTLSSSFYQNYPKSSYLTFVEKFIAQRQAPNNFKMIFDVGTELTLLSNELGNHISPKSSFSFKSSAFLSFKNTFLGIGLSVLDAEVNKNFTYEIPWTKDSTSNFMNLDFYLGYSQRLHKNLSISPFIAYRYSSLRHRFKDELDENLNELVRLNSHSPLLGFYLDIEFLHDYWEVLSHKVNKKSYSSGHCGLRLGFSYSFANYGRFTPELDGNMMMFSIKLMISGALPKKRADVRNKVGAGN